MLLSGHGRAALVLAACVFALHPSQQQTPNLDNSNIKLGGSKIRCSQMTLQTDELCSMIEQQVMKIRALEEDNSALRATVQQLTTKTQDLDKKKSSLQQEVSELHGQVQQLGSPEMCEERAPVKDEKLVEQGGRRYLFTRSHATWRGAEATCRSRKMSLVSVESSRDNEILLRAWQVVGTPEDTYWLSGNDLTRRGEFTWSSSGRHFGYTRWGAGQPHSDPTFHCVGVSLIAGERGLWFTNDCQVTYFVLCETAAKK